MSFKVVKIADEKWRVMSLPSYKVVTDLDKQQLEDLTFQLEVAIIDHEFPEEESK